MREAMDPTIQNQNSCHSKWTDFRPIQSIQATKGEKDTLRWILFQNGSKSDQSNQQNKRKTHCVHFRNISMLSVTHSTQHVR